MHRNVPKLFEPPRDAVLTANTNIDKGEIMSKMKEEMMRIQEEEFDQYVSFMEWVCDQEKELSESATNEEDEDLVKPSTPGTSIVHHNTLKTANNSNYNPTRSIK